MTDRLLAPIEAAAYLGVTISGLNKWRMKGGGPKYTKLSPGPRGRIRYAEADLRAFVAAGSRGSDLLAAAQ